tara:strand:+ start:317 stop:1390 length:1074 start_codon:yes stop_codon:yes gene_type:complete
MSYHQDIHITKRKKVINFIINTKQLNNEKTEIFNVEVGGTYSEKIIYGKKIINHICQKYKISQEKFNLTHGKKIILNNTIFNFDKLLNKSETINSINEGFENNNINKSNIKQNNIKKNDIKKQKQRLFNNPEHLLSYCLIDCDTTDIFIDVKLKVKGGIFNKIFDKVLDAIFDTVFMIFDPIIKPIRQILEAVLMFIKFLVWIINMFFWLIKLFIWFFAELLPTLPFDFIKMIQHLTKILFDGTIGVVVNIFKRLVNFVGDKTVKALFGWDNVPDSNNEAEDRKNAHFQGKCAGRKCYAAPDGTVPFPVIISTILCPPVGVFMEYGLSGWFQIFICSLLTLMFYFPGLLYALILIYC